MHKKEETGSAATRSPASPEKGKWFKHTPESDQRIRDGYASNERVLSIAKDLGVSRNVIIGRAFRLGLADPHRLEANQGKFPAIPTEESKIIRRAKMKAHWSDPAYRAYVMWRRRLAQMEA